MTRRTLLRFLGVAPAVLLTSTLTPEPSPAPTPMPDYLGPGAIIVPDSLAADIERLDRDLSSKADLDQIMFGVDESLPLGGTWIFVGEEGERIYRQILEMGVS